MNYNRGNVPTVSDQTAGSPHLPMTRTDAHTDYLSKEVKI
jgi:hypothetical protein